MAVKGRIHRQTTRDYTRCIQLFQSIIKRPYSKCIIVISSSISIIISTDCLIVFHSKANNIVMSGHHNIVQDSVKAEGLLHIPVFTSLLLSLHLSQRGGWGKGHTHRLSLVIWEPLVLQHLLWILDLDWCINGKKAPTSPSSTLARMPLSLFYLQIQMPIWNWCRPDYFGFMWRGV